MNSSKKPVVTSGALNVYKFEHIQCLCLQIFSANTDKDTPKIQILFCPRAVKCIRIQPTEWNNEIGMRFELVGCPIAKGGVPGLNVSYNNQVNHATQPLLTSPPTTPSTTAKHVSGASTGI